MSHYQFEEMGGHPARESTTRLMKSLKEILEETGADKLIDHGKTLPPGGVQPMDPAMAETARTAPPTPAQPAPAAGPSVPPRAPSATEAYMNDGQPRAALARPVCLGGPKRSLFSRLFG